MSKINGLYSSKEIADLYGIRVWTVRLVIERLGLDRRFGRNRVVYAEDLDKLEIAFKTLGYKIPDSPQPAAAATEVEGAPWE
jgi:hypothetical protein